MSSNQKAEETKEHLFSMLKLDVDEIADIRPIGNNNKEKRPVKVVFRNLSFDRKQELLKMNFKLKAEKTNIKIDYDRSPSDAKMNKALLCKRFQLKQENPAAIYKIKLNKLFGPGNVIFEYDFSDDSVNRI